MTQHQDEVDVSDPGADLAQIAAAVSVIRERTASLLARDPAVGPEVLLELARVVDGVLRTGDGLLVQVLSRVDEAKAVPGGTSTWLTAQLGYAPGRARRIAQDARQLGALPQVTEQLTSGVLPSGSPRVLARAVQAANTTEQDAAAAIADTVATLRREGYQAAERQVRVLEHTVPGHGEQQRARQRAAAFARISECEFGMARIDLLLDAERAAILRTALDLLVSTWLRERQFDHTNPLPDDVHTTEQLTAQAFVRLAEVFLAATEEQRANRYTPTVVYYAPAPSAPVQKSASQEPESQAGSAAGPVPSGCVETGYGAFIPSGRLPKPQDPAALHLTVDPDGQPTDIDGQPLDRDPAARLASPAQRLALAFRDRHCRFPGCTRPSSWSLHAHHRTPYSHNGPTTIGNLDLYCPQHHTLTHQTA